MSRVDWPFALLLVAVFAVMSVMRWRYFMSSRRRWNRPAEPVLPRNERGEPPH